MIIVKSPGNWVLQDRLELPPRNENICVAFDLCNVYQPQYFNIFVQVEPDAVFEHLYRISISDYLLQNAHKYNLIVTQNEKVLQRIPQSRKYVQGTTWIPENVYNNIDLLKKKFCISSVTGKKAFCIGHRFRHALWNLQTKIQVPCVFFRSMHGCPKEPFNTKGCPTLNTTKEELFLNFQQSIVIENSQQKNYFTEKLLDCLITKTIPIYWGCPNIDDFFETDGWIILTDANANIAIQKINEIQEFSYEKYLATVEENQKKCFQYINFYDNVNQAFNS